MNPVIGITTRTKTENKEVYDGVPRVYARAIEIAGGLPVLLPLFRNPEMYHAICSLLDGLLVNGEADVNPRLYKEKPEDSCGKPDKEKDEMEMKLIKWALGKNIPILGICRGQQLLAVTCGGTLYQDVPNRIVRHKPEKQDSESLHLIGLEDHTKLRNIFNLDIVAVSSNHHQAIKDLPSDFKISARAKDGVIEGIEKKNNHFVIGVQFHPEKMCEKYPKINLLFTAFVNAAREYHLLKTKRKK